MPASRSPRARRRYKVTSSSHAARSHYAEEEEEEEEDISAADSEARYGNLIIVCLQKVQRKHKLAIHQPVYLICFCVSGEVSGWIDDYLAKSTGGKHWGKALELKTA